MNTIQTTSRSCLSGFLLFAITCSSLTAQSLAPAAKPTADDEIVTLPAFNVTNTQGKGYVANDAVTGLKSRQLLIDIPQSVQVVPRDIIEDLGQYGSLIDTVKYVSSGSVPFSRTGEFQIQRGFRSGSVLLDGQIDLAVTSDTVSYDSIEVVKGPAAVLYGNRTSLAGIIVKNSKTPLPVSRHSTRLIVGEGGMLRGELALTGPAGKIGATAVSYRVVGAYQDFDGYERVDHDNKRVYAASLKFDFSRNTSLLLQADYYENDNRGIFNGFENQAKTGVYTGPGFDQGYKAKWSNQGVERGWYKATLTHQFSDKWDMVATVTRNAFDRKDRETRNQSAPNWTAGTIQQYYFGWNYQEDLLAAQIDVTGEYEIAGLKNQSTFGGSADRSRTLQNFWFLRTMPPTSITNPDTYALPMPVYDSSNAEPTSRGTSNYGFGYYMHTLHIVPDRFTLIAGMSGSYVSSDSTNLRTNVTTTTRANGEPRRLGAVYKPTKDISIYVNNSTTFQGSGSRDAAGNLLPPIEGEVREIGVKTSLFGGRLSSTITYFDLNVTGVLVPDSVTGLSRPTGRQDNKGFEVDIAARPTENWTVMASYYDGDIRGVDGSRLANSINESYSLLTRYDFASGPLKGAILGGSLFHQGDRAGAAWPDYTIGNLFAGYARDSWSVMVNVDNVTDEVYSGSGWGNVFMEVGASRNAKVSFSYRF